MAATNQSLPGIIAAAYRNTGTYGSPTWTEITSVRDGTLGDAWAFADASIRRTRVMLFGKTQIDLSSTLNMRADPADDDYIAFYTASQSATAVLDLLLLNAKITVEGAIGVRGEFLIGRDPENQPIDGIIYNTFQLKPVDTANGVPGYAVVGASSTVTFTDY